MLEYRVKFVDIRTNPPGGRRRGGAKLRVCEHKGCDATGDCKAPKPYAARAIPTPGQRQPADDSYWFCQRHAAEYNQSYDFFDGMTEPEIAAFHASAHYGHRRTWRFGAGPVGGTRSASIHQAKRWNGKGWFDGDQGAEPEAAKRQRRLTRLQVRALDELQLSHEATPEDVRRQYGALIKRFHPDSNGGDRSMEHRLTVVIRAFKALKSTGLA
jgi:hypothetical protein